MARRKQSAQPNTAPHCQHCAPPTGMVGRREPGFPEGLHPLGNDPNRRLPAWLDKGGVLDKLWYCSHCRAVWFIQYNSRDAYYSSFERLPKQAERLFDDRTPITQLLPLLDQLTQPQCQLLEDRLRYGSDNRSDAFNLFATQLSNNPRPGEKLCRAARLVVAILADKRQAITPQRGLDTLIPLLRLTRFITATPEYGEAQQHPLHHLVTHLLWDLYRTRQGAILLSPSMHAILLARLHREPNLRSWLEALHERLPAETLAALQPLAIKFDRLQSAAGALDPQAATVPPLSEQQSDTLMDALNWLTLTEHTHGYGGLLKAYRVMVEALLRERQFPETDLNAVKSWLHPPAKKRQDRERSWIGAQRQRQALRTEEQAAGRTGNVLLLAGGALLLILVGGELFGTQTIKTGYWGSVDPPQVLVPVLLWWLLRKAGCTRYRVAAKLSLLVVLGILLNGHRAFFDYEQERIAELLRNDPVLASSLRREDSDSRLYRNFLDQELQTPSGLYFWDHLHWHAQAGTVGEARAYYLGPYIKVHNQGVGVWLGWLLQGVFLYVLCLVASLFAQPDFVWKRNRSEGSDH